MGLCSHRVSSLVQLCLDKWQCKITSLINLFPLCRSYRFIYNDDIKRRYFLKAKDEAWNRTSDIYFSDTGVFLGLNQVCQSVSDFLSWSMTAYSFNPFLSPALQQPFLPSETTRDLGFPASSGSRGGPRAHSGNHVTTLLPSLAKRRGVTEAQVSNGCYNLCFSLGVVRSVS